MPRIPQYESQVGASTGLNNPGRRAQGSDFGGGGFEAGRALMTAADSLYDTVERQEVSDVQARLAKARADWTVHLQERGSATTPGDTTFAGKFNQDFSDYLSKTGEGLSTAGGQRAFQRGAAELSAHFVEKAGVFQSQLAGAKAKQDYLTLLDSSRNTLLNDPFQFQDVLRSTQDALNDPSGMYARMPAAERELLSRQTRMQLALSAVQGTTRISPEHALSQLQSGKFDEYLDADNKAALLKNAEVAIEGKRVEQERLRVEAERAERKAQEATADKFVAKFYGEGSLSTKEVINSNLTPAQKEHWLNNIRTANKAERIVTDPSLLVDLWDRTHLPDGDPRKIVNEEEIDAYFGRGLTAENVKMLRDEMRLKRTAAGDVESQQKNSLITMAKSQLTGSQPLLGIRDPKGDEQLHKFLMYFTTEYDAQRKAGKSATALLNPDSPDYLGKALAQFRRTPQQMMKDLMENNAGISPLSPAAPAAPAVEYKTPEEVGAAFKAGKISRPDAAKILNEKFGIK